MEGLNINEIWHSLTQELAQEKMNMLNSGLLKINNRTMKFVYEAIGNRPPNGYTLIFGFHGGGGCQPHVNDQQFNNHKKLYHGRLPNGCIWFVPRSIQNLSDMWHRPYFQDFLLEIIRAFAFNNIIDPNKVFLTGFSAGGDGIYHMAPRMADYLAGAAMMSGHPNKVNLINIRNIAFSIEAGGKDTAYNRNNEAKKYISSLNKLRKNYGGYQHMSHVHEDKGHWLNLQESKIFNWLFSHVRNPYPQVIIFLQHPRRPKNLFYYIRLEDLPQNPVKDHNNEEQTIILKNGNQFHIISNRVVTIMVNRKMVNPNYPISITHNGILNLSNLCMKTNYDVMFKTAKQRLDRQYIFEDEFTSVPPRIITKQDFDEGVCSYFKISKQDIRQQYRESSPLSKKKPGIKPNLQKPKNLFQKFFG